MRKTLLRTFGLLFFALLGVMTGNAQNSFPYAVDFMTATDLSGWTVVDNSTAPGVSWEWGKGYKTKTADNEVLDNNMCAVIKDDTSEFNDYLVSPAFQLTKGNTYYISVRGQKRGYQFLDVEVGKSATDMSKNKVVKDNIDSDLGQWAKGWYELSGHCYAQTVTVEYTATETGTFHFSLRARSIEGDTNADMMAFLIYDIAINEQAGGPQALPYSINFAEHQRGWKAVDNSSTAYKTWGVDMFYDDNSQNNYTAVMPMYDGDYEWNDYYISPLFTLEAGKSYKVKSCTWKNMDPSEFNLALMLGKSQKDASAFQKISDINMQLNYDANVTDDHVFAVEETGDYRLAYLATTAAATNQKIALTNFEIEETTKTPEVTIGKIEETPEPEPEPEPVEVPYNVVFNAETNDWTTIDASSEAAATWSYDADGFWDKDLFKSVGCYAMPEFDTAGPNDYLVSPGIKLETGKTYTVKTTTGKLYSTPTVLSLEMATSNTDATAFNKLGNIEMADNQVQYINSFDVTVEADGVYYLAFHALNTSEEKPTWGNVYAMSFSIDEKAAPEEAVKLPYEIAFDSADKFATWSTLDNSDVPGKTWEFNASDFAGKPSAFMGPDAGSATCDWLISPKFELQEGKTYVIKLDGDTGTDNATSVILDYFPDSKDKENAKTIAWIGSSLPMTDWNTQEPITEWTLEVTKSGSYYFGLRALNSTPNQEKDAISIYSFSVEEQQEGEPETPVALPYNTSFAEEAGAAGWTAMDRSDNVKSTWAWNSYGYEEYNEDWVKVGENHPCVGFSSDWDTNANDYFVSPLFTLEVGKTYVVKTHTATNRSCFNDKTTSFTMKLGTNKKVQGTFTQSIGDIELNTVYDRDPSKFELTVKETGNYYVAYHISDPDGSKAYGYIFDFSIAEKTEAQPVATTAVTEFTAKEAGDLKTINLKWKNPTKDVDGNDLAADAKLSVKVFEGETLLTTVAGTPGAEGSYSYKPETYAGLHEYKVVVVYNELESEAATTTLTVVVNGINGAIVIPAGAEVSVRTLGGALVGNNFSTLAKGTYLVTVKTVDGKVKTMKVTK